MPVPSPTDATTILVTVVGSAATVAISVVKTTLAGAAIVGAVLVGAIVAAVVSLGAVGEGAVVLKTRETSTEETVTLLYGPAAEGELVVAKVAVGGERREAADVEVEIVACAVQSGEMSRAASEVLSGNRRIMCVR